MSEPPARPVLAAISSNRLSGPQQHLSVSLRSMEETSKEEDATQQSLTKSDDSNISNLSLLSEEDHADDLHRRMLNHARQGQTRWSKRSALDSEPLNVHQPFRKSKPGLGLISMMRDPSYDNNDGYHLPDVDPIAHERPLSPNFPRHWGRKGKQRNEFLKRLSATATEKSPPNPHQNSTDESVERTTQFIEEKDMPVDSERYHTMQKRPILPTTAQETKKDVAFDTVYDSKAGQTRKSEREAMESNHQANDGDALAQSSHRLSRAGMTHPWDFHRSTTSKPQLKPHEVDPTRKYGSRDLLQQLARAASLSPSPPRVNPHSLVSQGGLQEKDGSLDPPAKGETKNAGQGLEKRRLPFSRTTTRTNNNTTAPARMKKRVDFGQQVETIPQNLDLESPGGFLAEEPSQGDLSTLLDLDQDTLDLVSNVSVPLSRGEDLRSEEKEALQRMSKALRSVRTGLRDASLGIQRVRHQFAQADGQKSEEAGRCRACNSGGDVTLNRVIANTWGACRAYFYSRPKERGGYIKFTWFGLVFLAILIWLVTEITLCEYYCHPIYAKYMVGYGVDIRRPRMPYVTTTIMIKRPLEWITGLAWQREK